MALSGTMLNFGDAKAELVHDCEYTEESAKATLRDARAMCGPDSARVGFVRHTFHTISCYAGRDGGPDLFRIGQW